MRMQLCHWLTPACRGATAKEVALVTAQTALQALASCRCNVRRAQNGYKKKRARHASTSRPVQIAHRQNAMGIQLYSRQLLRKAKQEEEKTQAIPKKSNSAPYADEVMMPALCETSEGESIKVDGRPKGEGEL